MALSDQQLNATVTAVEGGSPPGELSYDPDFGTVLDAGFHTLTVTAAQTQNYREATASVSITVSGVSLLDDGTLLIVGTDGDDRVHLNGQGKHGLKVHTDFFLDGKHKTFSTANIDRIVVELLGGDDRLTTAGNVHIPLLVRAGSGNDRIHLAGGPAVVVGGSGNDDIKGGAGRNVLIGGWGSNKLKAGRGGDVLVAGATKLDNDDEALFDLLERWNSNDSLADRMDEVIATLAGKVIYDDAAVNTLHGGAGHDLFFADLEDKLKGNKRGYTVVNR